MYLLDTNVISAMSPVASTKIDNAQFRDWVVETSSALFVSAITVAEIEEGISKANRLGAKAERLGKWFELLIHLYSERILPLDIQVTRLTGQLLDRAAGLGGSPDFEDAAIAATAKAKGLTVLTRNARHFRFFDVPFFDPFSSLPD